MAIRPRLPRGVRVESIGEPGASHLLLHPDAPRWAALNRTGLEMAQLCDGTRTAGEIAGALAERYGLEPSAVLADVLACLEDLDRAGLLEDSPGPAPKGERTGWRLHLYLTERCNLRCAHCGVAAGTHPADALTGRVVHRLVDQAVAAGVDGVAFGGGEPLVRPDCLDLLRYSVARVNTLLATNGLLIDDRLAAALAAAGVLVQISLDGATAEVHDAIRGPGAFDRTWQAIRHLQRAGVGQRLSLNVTLMRSNIDQVGQIIALAEAEGIGGGVRFTQLQRMGRAALCWHELSPTSEQYAQAYRWLYRVRPASVAKKVPVSPGLPGLELEPPDVGMWCRLGKLLLVDATGDIYPCSLLVGPQFRLGNVADTSVAEALTAPALRQLVQLCEARPDQIEACRGCAWSRFCQASCPGSAWCTYGTWYATDDLCELRRGTYRTTIGRQVVTGGAGCLP